MNKFFLTLAAVVIWTASACQSGSSKIETLRWLEGNWIRTNESAGKTTSETWNRTAGSLSGWGVTLKGQDTVFVEKLAIVEKDGDLFYVADVPENPSPVQFRFTSLGESGFECENPKHDFPKKITYALLNGTLKATISGDGKSIDYFFERRP